jgi:hypothetical protein
MLVEICDSDTLARRQALCVARQLGKQEIVEALLKASGVSAGIDDLIPELPKRRVLEPNVYREAAAEKKRKKRAERNMRERL